MNSDDSEGLVAAMQYIEAVFTVVTTETKTGILNPSRGRRRLPGFQARARGRLPRSTLGDDPLDDMKANLVFTYLLAKGKVPKAKWGCVLVDDREKIPFSGTSRRTGCGMLQIFAAIAEANGRQPSSVGHRQNKFPSPSEDRSNMGSVRLPVKVFCWLG